MQIDLDKKSRTGSNAVCTSNFHYLCDHSPLDFNFFVLKWGFGVMLFIKISFNDILFAYAMHHF